MIKRTIMTELLDPEFLRDQISTYKHLLAIMQHERARERVQSYSEQGSVKILKFRNGLILECYNSEDQEYPYSVAGAGTLVLNLCQALVEISKPCGITGA